MPEPELIKIGKITTTHGLKGEVKVFFYTDSISTWFEPGKTIYLKDGEKGFRSFVISSFKLVPGVIGLMRLEGIETIEEVMPYVRMNIFGEKVSLEGKIYLADLVGMQVYASDSRKIGIVDDFEQIAGKTYLIINGRYVPYVVDVFIASVDSENGILTLTEQGEEIYLHA